MRGRNITITDPLDIAHTINIDNEELTFRNTLKLDTHDSSDQKYSVDIFVDTDNYFTQYNGFVLNNNQMINPKEFQEGQIYRIVHKLEGYKSHPERF